jgi:1,4-dihydroxy-6-naphthoate synthase
MEMMQTIRLAFSPDADDLFMFWPLLSGKIPSEARGLAFVHERVETESLNARSEAPGAQAPDVCAVSIAQMPAIADRYLLLPHGGSVGRGYGPVVVAKRPMRVDDLANKRVAIPGARTTAHLVLRLLVGSATKGATYEPVPIAITPFDRVFRALDAGEVDAALLIHEGRLTYEDDASLHRVIEIGEAWHAWTGHPLPLGGNAIRRDLGEDVVRVVSHACRASIAWSLAHRDEVMDAIVSSGVRAEANVTRARLDRYLAMYANADSAGYDAIVVRAIEDLFDRGASAGLLPATRVDFAP